MTDLSGARVHHAVGCPAHRARDNLPLGVLGVLALDDPHMSPAQAEIFLSEYLTLQGNSEPGSWLLS